MKFPESLLAFGLSVQIFGNVSASPTRQHEPLVDLQNGTLCGRYEPNYDQEYFLGIPYAEPPTGNRRFAKLEPAAAWKGTKNAQHYGDWCPGNPSGFAGFSQTTNDTMSEDCLFMNVIRPTGTSVGSGLPVLVWIHGGGWLEGGSADGRYNGSFLVEESVNMGMPIIFVSFNYRMGAFGILAGSVLEEAGLVNAAQHDQRQALAWVQANIAHFGGDPSLVTVMGESAGAISIGAHLLAYGGRDDGLFRGAILQSGGPLAGNNTNRSPSQRDEDFNTVLQGAGCGDSTDPLACLRAASMDTLKLAGRRLQAYLVVDKHFISGHSIDQLEQGQFIKVPILIGTNRNEGTVFTQHLGRIPVNTDDDFKKFVSQSWGGGSIPDQQLQSWNDMYQQEINHPSVAGLGTVAENAGPELGAQYGKASLWMGDMMFTAGRRYANKIWAKHGVKSFSYFFDGLPVNVDAETYGAGHFQEIPYMFDNINGVGWDKNPFPTDPNLKEKHDRLAKIMSRMWISFVVKQSPNFHRVPDVALEWPPYTNTSEKNMVFNLANGVELQSDDWRNDAMEILYQLASEAEGKRSTKGHSA